VDDAGAVRLVERVGDLHRNRQRLIERKRALLQSLGERHALQVLHDQEVGRMLVPDVVQRADVRMVQRGDRASFVLESLAKLRVGGQGLGQHLDRDDALEPSVAGFVDFTHSAFAKLGENLVRAQACTGGQRHAYDT